MKKNPNVHGTGEDVQGLQTEMAPVEEEHKEEEIGLVQGEEVAYAPDGGYGWVIVLASFLSNFVLDGISLSQASLQDSILESAKNDSTKKWCRPEQVLNASFYNCTPGSTIRESEYQAITSVLLCVTLVSGPFVSLLTDRFGYRKIGIAGSLLASLGLVLAWVPSIVDRKANIYVIIAFFGGISGLGFGLMFQASIVIVGLYFDKWRPLAIGLAVAGTGCGTFAFPPVLTAIARNYTWFWAYIFQSAVALISVFFAFMYRPLPTKTVFQTVQPQERRRSFPQPTVEKMSPLSMWKSMEILICSPTFMLISISGLFTMVGFFGPYGFLVGKSRYELGRGDYISAFLVSYIGISNTICRIVFGYVSTFSCINPLLFSNIALTVAGLATLAVPFMQDYWLLVVFAVVFGAGVAIFVVLRSILVLKLMGVDKFNNGYGLSLLFMGIGTVIGNPLGGLFVVGEDKTKHDYSGAFFLAGSTIVFSAILCYPLQMVRDWETRRQTLTANILMNELKNSQNLASEPGLLPAEDHIPVEEPTHATENQVHI